MSRKKLANVDAPALVAINTEIKAVSKKRARAGSLGSSDASDASDASNASNASNALPKKKRARRNKAQRKAQKAQKAAQEVTAQETTSAQGDSANDQDSENEEDAGKGLAVPKDTEMQGGSGSNPPSDIERDEMLDLTTSHPINQEQWLAGYPVPEEQAPEGMTVKTTFAPRPVKQLGPNQLQEAVTKWQKNDKARPHHARLLKFETLANSKKLMAAYLGFPDVPQFLHFIDFIGKLIHTFMPHMLDLKCDFRGYDSLGSHRNSDCS